MDPVAAVFLFLLVVGPAVWLLVRRAEGRRAAERRAAEPVTLREAAERVVAVSLESLRVASKRDPRFPAPVRLGARRAGLYRPEDIVEWYRSRPGRPARLDQGLDRAATMRAVERR